jgi:hypothetical protein
LACADHNIILTNLYDAKPLNRFTFPHNTAIYNSDPIVRIFRPRTDFGSKILDGWRGWVDFKDLFLLIEVTALRDTFFLELFFCERLTGIGISGSNSLTWVDICFCFSSCLAEVVFLIILSGSSGAEMDADLRESENNGKFMTHKVRAKAMTPIKIQKLL